MRAIFRHVFTERNGGKKPLMRETFLSRLRQWVSFRAWACESVELGRNRTREVFHGCLVRASLPLLDVYVRTHAQENM